MKKITLLLVALIAFTSCSSDDNDNTTDFQPQFEAINEDLPRGTWMITEYRDIEGDRTELYSSFTITFRDNGTSTAINNILSQSGTWIYVIDEETEELNLDYGSQDPFDRLTEDWDIQSATTTTIVLMDEDGDDTKMMTLTAQ